MKRSRNKNFDLFSTHAWFVPGIKEMFVLLALLLVGYLLGSLLQMAMGMVYSPATAATYGMIVSYPSMFVPPLIYAGLKSRSESIFGHPLPLDSARFAPYSAAVLTLGVVFATFSTAFLCDALNELMPPMPAWLEDALKTVTTGPLWVNFLCVSIMAPILEEWLCRGLVLRGLLHARRPLRPAWAIAVSAAFFAFIHLNPWQALPAFVLGCLFGYVYWKTGSLKLTILMHFTNNTIALVASRMTSLEADATWMDLLPTGWYILCALICALFLYYFLRKVSAISSEAGLPTSSSESPSLS